MANLLLINLFLSWSNRCFVIDNPIVGQEPTFTITDTQLYVPVVTLSTHDNAKLLEQLQDLLKYHFARGFWHFEHCLCV